MWNRLLTYRRLGWALLLSLLLHALLMGETPSWLQAQVDFTPPIEVELMPLPEPAPSPATLLPKSKPARQVAQPRVPEPAPAPEPPPESVSEAVPEVVTEPPAPASPEPLPVAETPATPLPPVAEVPAEAEPGVVAEATVPPPRHVEIDFRVSYKGSDAGVERHRYHVRDDGSYSLSSVAEAQGLLGMFLSELRQQSDGRVTEQGLRPNVFVYQYGDNADRLQKAVFDWQKNRLWLQSGRRVQEVDLQQDAQDLLSFMYQFMFSPPLQQMSLPITNGKRLKIYDYGFEGEETLATKMGELRCIHILRESGSGEEKTELWLAADYHYLPVRIRMSEKDGKVTERNAVRLQLN